MTEAGTGELANVVVGRERTADQSAQGLATPLGNRIDKMHVNRMLWSRASIGRVVHKGDSHPRECDAMIDCSTWVSLHPILKENPNIMGDRTPPRRLNFSRA